MRYGSIVGCPFCHAGGLRTSDSRVIEGTLWCIRRRRHCPHCKRTFQSFEILAEDYQHLEKYAVVLQGLRQLLEPVQNDLLSPPAPARDAGSAVLSTLPEKGKSK